MNAQKAHVDAITALVKAGKSEGKRTTQKKAAEKLIHDQWIAAEVGANLIDENPNVHLNSGEIASDANEHSQLAPAPEQQEDSQFVLTSNQPISAAELKDVARIVVGASQQQKCQINEDGGHLQIKGDIPKLLAAQLQEMAVAIKDLCSESLHIPSAQLHVTALLDVESQLLSMNLGWEVTLPALHLQGGRGKELQACISTFVQTLCRQEDWNDGLADTLPEGCGKRVAITVAKKLRIARGGSLIATGAKIECIYFDNAFFLGERIGPAPEEEKTSSLIVLSGAFRGLNGDEKKSFFSVNGLVQAKCKVLQFKEEQHEEVYRLSTPKLKWCSVEVMQHFIAEKLDHLELLKIVGEIPDMHDRA
jgi:hypothetical protein